MEDNWYASAQNQMNSNETLSPSSETLVHPGSGGRIGIDKSVGLIALIVVSAGVGYWAGAHRTTAAAITAAPQIQTQAPAGTLSPAEQVTLAEAEAKRNATPENFLNLSLMYYRAGKFNETITAAQQALKMRPGYPEAYNNIAAGHQALGQWDQAIVAGREAVRLKPDFELARNNLAFAQSQKARTAAK
jgi:tetratricopeptide (TPR) repeat protein